MTKPFGLFVLLLMCISPALAQESAPAPQDQSAAPQEKPEKPKAATPKYELSAGYARRSYYQPITSTIWLNGWYASAAYNRWRWLGAEAEGMGVYKNQGGFLGNTSIYDFLVGPKLYPLGHRKLTPFGHVLLGIAYYRNTTAAYGGYPSATKTANTFAWEAGGGLDLNLSQHWSVRLIQLDYGGANFFGGSSSTVHGATRVAAGFVYRFGEK